MPMGYSGLIKWITKKAYFLYNILCGLFPLSLGALNPLSNETIKEINNCS